jgi:hypothetical protein
VRVNDKTKKQKDEIRKILRERDGNLCQIDFCMDEETYRKKEGKSFDLHHIDENPYNWNWDNIVLAAHGCNVRLTPHGKGRYSQERFDETFKSLRIRQLKSVTDMNKVEVGYMRVKNAEFLKSSVCKPIMTEELDRIIKKYGKAEKNDLINAMSNASDLSPDVCKKYLSARTNSFNGELEEYSEEIEGETKKYIRKRTQCVNGVNGAVNDFRL